MDDLNALSLIHIYSDNFYVNIPDQESNYFLSGNPSGQTAVFTLSTDFDQESQLFLQKMLGACQIQSNAYKALALHHPDRLFTALIDHETESNLIFGLSMQSEIFSVQRPINKPFRFRGKKYLLCRPLAELLHDTTAKAELWTQGLKPLYGL
ncbi:MAG: hypothetical protein JNM44_13120 [Chitinophagaceae bacterium]|nr:hypothetical protein [Chitinophagaceae bacterium]